MKRLICILLFSFLPFILCSQTLAHRHFGIEDGLMQSQGDNLYLDSRGYLWIGTRGGISVFNGEDIRSYNRPTNLKGTKVKFIAEDTSGQIYGLNHQGIFCFNGVLFKPVIKSDKNFQYIKIDDQNRLWVYWDDKQTNFKGIDVFDISNNFKQVNIELLNNDSLFHSNRSICLLEYPDGYGIIGKGRSNNWLFLNKENSLREITPFFAMEQFLKAHCKLTFPQGDCAFDLKEIMGKESGLVDSSGIISIMHTFLADHYQTHSNPFTYIDKDANELIQIDFRKTNVKSYDIGQDHYFYRYKIDPENRIWAGLETGFMQLFEPFVLEYNKGALDLTWSIIPVGEDGILFGSFYGGLILKKKSKYQRLKNHCFGSNTRFYMGAKKLKDGRILMPSGDGLYIFNQDFDCKNALATKEELAESPTLQEIAVNDDETIALGASVNGIQKFNIKKGQLKILEKIRFDNPEYRGIYVNDIFISNKQTYIVGHERGLSVYNVKTGKWKDYNKTNSFPTGDVASIYRDKHDNYWFGTGQGLVFMDTLGDFQLIDDPLIYGVVNVVDSFDQNHIILGGTFGLCILDLNAWYEEGEIRGKIFNNSNGYMAGEPAENAIYRMNDSSLMIGTQTYPVQIFPKKMNLTVRPLKTRVLSVNDTLLPFTDPEPSITLPKKVDDVRIDFEAIGMYRPVQKTLYSYKLNGGEWSEWQEERFVEFNNLGSGDHSFQLRAQTPGIDPSRQPISSMSFATSVPIWQEPFFPEVLGGLLIAAILTLAILALVNYYQRRRNLRYATQIDYLRIQSLQAQMNPHFVFNILGTLQNMILQSDIKRANRQLVNLSTLIRRFLESTVQGNLPVGQAAIREQSLEKEIELLKLYIEFEQVQHKGLFDYTIDIDPALDTANMSIPPMLIQPFVENAIKHGLMNKDEKGHLWLRFSLENEQLHCIIEDDGVGRERAAEIRSQSMQANRSYGTELVKERIELLNKMNYRIDCTIEDREGGGTKVTLKIGP